MSDPKNPIEDVQKHRSQLAAYARNKKCRALGWPRDWNPGMIINPVSGLPLTDSGAWELIADLLESEHPLELVVMDEPKGKMGFVLKYGLGENSQPLYIKIHFGAGCVIGRSFHLSHYA